MMCALLLGGCAVDDHGNAPAKAEDTAAAPTLVVDGPAELSVLPNGSIELRVRFANPDGGSVAGVTVDFALTGAPLGASLTPTRATTDENGVAVTKLLVGSMPGTLKVRADTRDATEATSLTVVVRKALDVQLAVTVAYEGLREIASYTVTALDGMECQKALAAGIAGDVVYRIDSTDQPVDFSLAPDLSTALVAWGRDKSGGQLARGCINYRAPITATVDEASAELVIALSDTVMDLDRALPVALQLDATTAVQLLASSVTATVDATLGSVPHADAALYLDAIARRLNRAGSELAGRRAELSAALAEADVGPKTLAVRVGALLATRGAELAVRATYEFGKGVSESALRAVASDGSKSLDLAGSPSVAVTAHFDAVRASLTIDPLRIDLPVGAYGKALLGALAEESASAYRAKLDEAAGCSEVVGPWAAAQGVADAATAAAGCTDAVAALSEAVDVAFDALPAQPIELRGKLQVHDRSEDGSVDDLGPGELAGTWGTLAVQSELRAQAQATLAL